MTKCKKNLKALESSIFFKDLHILQVIKISSDKQNYDNSKKILRKLAIKYKRNFQIGLPQSYTKTLSLQIIIHII